MLNRTKSGPKVTKIKHKNKLKEKLKIGICGTIFVTFFSIVGRLADFTSLASFIQLNILPKNAAPSSSAVDLGYAPTSLAQAFAQAQLYYDEGEYLEAVKVYCTDFLQDNAIAQCNLGYLYANCLPTSPNLNIADDYYKKAYANGCKIALTNMLALHIKTFDNFSNIEQIIHQGIKDENIDIMRFVTQTVMNPDSDELDDNIEFYNRFCQNLISQPLDKDLFYCWEDCGESLYTTVPRNTETERYVLLKYTSGYSRNFSTLTGENISSYTGGIYRVYRRVYVNTDALNERFIRV